jgi:hypothetical protein
MIHYSCDRCKRTIDPQDELRYVVKMEISAVVEPVEIDDERDHLLEVHEILEKLNDSDIEELDDEGNRQQRFDLCPECYGQFVKNPIGRDVAAQLGFSSN